MALGVIGKLCARDVCRLCFTAYMPILEGHCYRVAAD